MYTVSKGPSKMVHKTRRGLSQNLDRLDNLRDNIKKSADVEDGDFISVPKPVFHTVNGKKSNSARTQQEQISPQHEEIIKFIYESWTSVCQECVTEQHDSSSSTIVYYEDGEPNNTLQDFKPFDLESWWGKRLFNTITKSVP
uniref:MAPK regulated corepressor interacting protein 2 n=1 Tax=Clastoptera arizonana TaxID=38151 RepID=A0A1B6CSM9_9HEMI